MLVRRPPVGEDDALFALFVHESAFLANLEELSIAGVEEFGSLADGGAYAVLESTGDETLRALIEREGRLSVPFAASIGRQVAEAAAALAESGILPGALTSDRVGIRRRELRPAVRLARFPGTVLQNAEGAEIPTLGGLLYEMLSGQPAGRHAGTGQPPPPIQRARPDLPESLGWLVMQCLHPSDTARPRSLAEIVRRLSPFEQVAAEPPRHVEIPAEPSLPVAAEPPVEAFRLPAPPPPAVFVQPPPPEEASPEIPPPAAVIPSAAEEALPPRPLAIEPAFQRAFAIPERPMPPGIQEQPMPPRIQEKETADTPPRNPAPAPVESAPVLPLSLERTPGPTSRGNAEASGETPPAPDTPTACPASPPALPWAAELAADFRNRQPKSSPADSAITAEIPILRPRYSYRNTPHPPTVKKDDDAGPRPMFLEPPSAPVSSVAPPPPPAAPVRPAWRSRPPVSRGSFEVPRESSPSGSIRNRQNFPPPPAPPLGGPSSGLARTFGGPLSGLARTAAPRPAVSSPPGRQIPISEERREARSPAPEDASSSSVAANEPVPVDSGIGSVTVGEDRTGEFETARKAPRPGFVWGIAAAIAAGILALFWFVIEATPPRKDAPLVGTRPGRIEVETSPVRATAAPGAAAAPISGDITAAAEPSPAVTAPSRSGPSSTKSRLPAPEAVRPAPPSRVASRERVPAAPAPSRESEPAPPPAESRNTLVPATGGLRDALDAWVDSTNARDLSGHMRFYLPRVNTFYLTRNVSRNFIRQEKARLFQGGSVSVTAGEPEIDPSPDGRTATIRFRKRYAVSGARGEKRGEVLQEMKWVRTPDGWRIASERDAKVLASR